MDSIAKIVMPQLNKAALTAAQEYAESLVFNLKEKLSQTGGPSAPGEYPHMQTGELVSSIKSEVTASGNQIDIRIYSDDATGKVLSLEYGSRKMEARPFMAPTLLIAKKEAPAIIAQAVRNNMD